MMQSALNNPIAPLEFDPAQRIQFFEAQAADQIHRFGALLAVASHPPPPPRNQSRSGKTHLLRRHLPAFQDPNLPTAAIAFAHQGASLRRGWRGKNRSGSGASPGFEPVPSGFL